jgi:hypothetical protein
VVRLNTTVNTALVADLGKTGHFDPKAVTQTAEAVAKLHQQMREEFKVPAERIYVVGSSGLFSPIRDKEDLVKENKAALAEAVRKAVDREMGFVSEQREAELSIIGVVPKAEAERAVLVDIGSGNTKGGYRDADGKLITFSVPLGTLSFTDLVRAAAEKNRTPFVRQAEASRRESLAPPLRQAFAGKAGLAGREYVYLSGGSAWAAATFLHPRELGPYVELTARDCAAFEAWLQEKAGEYPAPNLAAIADDELRKQAAAEVERVKKVYSPEQLLAGAEVLRALSDELAFDARGKRIYFARHAYLGWLLPYLVEQAGKSK